MSEQYEDYLLKHILANLLNSLGGQKLPENVERFLSGNERVLGYQGLELKKIQQEIPCYFSKPIDNLNIPKSALEKNIRVFSKNMQIKPSEMRLFGLLVRIKTMEIFEEIADLYDEVFKKSSTFLILSKILGCKKKEVVEALKYDGNLFRKGLITWDGPINQTYCFSQNFEIEESVLKALDGPVQKFESMFKIITGKPCTTSLTMSNFSYLEEDTDLIIQILKEATLNKHKGVNILFYGVPGTGKTEFCKVIAKKLKLICYSSESNLEEYEKRGGSPRLHKFITLQNIISGQNNSIILFDEMEDVLTGNIDWFTGRRNAPSKLYFNRILETNAVPTIWTSNKAYLFDPAFLRRFTYIKKFKIPNTKAREKLWSRALKGKGVSFDKTQISSLAHKFEVPPSFIEQGSKIASVLGGSLDHTEKALSNLCSVLSMKKNPEPQTGTVKFRPSLYNTSLSIPEFIKKLEAMPGRNFSLCLFGPPGTGKTFLANHLAGILEMEVMEKKVSELLSMWVGGTEKLIAEAFEEARENDKFLLFNEADSLLKDRRGAKNSWEITQVNEMLRWMEDHPLPFVCTTNLMDNMDAASLRRFIFKINCKYLDNKGAAEAFRVFFGRTPPSNLAALSTLTPGDFTLVKKKAEIMGVQQDPEALLAMLVEECKLKGQEKGDFGFRVR